MKTTSQKIAYFKNLLAKETNPAKKAFFCFRIEVLEEILNHQNKSQKILA